MVASDTVVGLIGAGVLLVALVGVFVYESQDGASGPSSAALLHKQYPITSTGSYQSQDKNPPNVPDPICTPPACTPASTSITLSITGLPAMPGLSLLVFLHEGNNHNKVGAAMSRSGDKYDFSFNEARSHQASELIVALAKDASATAPDWPLVTYVVSSGAAVSLDGPRPTSISFGGSGEAGQTVSFTPAGAEMNVRANLKGLENRTGYKLSGWMVKANGTSLAYDYVGDAATTAGATSGTITGDAAGNAAAWDRFIVTVEPEGAAGASPKGPAVLEALTKPPPSAPVVK